MSIFNRIRTLSFTALVGALAVAPGCDDGTDYEALGVEADELDAMSDEELEALELDRVSLEEDLPCITHGSVEGEFAAAEEDEDGEDGERPEVIHDDLAIERQWTHTERPGVLVGAPGELVQPVRPTHAGRPVVADTDELGLVPEPLEPCDLPRDEKFAAKG